MHAGFILTNVAILILAGTLWHDARHEPRPRGPRRTWLLVAAIFAIVSTVVHFIGP